MFAVFRIWGGVLYTGSSFIEKANGKAKIQAALLSIAVLAISFIVFQKVNPETLKVRFDLASSISKATIREFKELLQASLTVQQAQYLVDRGYVFTWMSGTKGSEKKSYANAASCVSSARGKNLEGPLFQNKCQCWHIDHSIKSIFNTGPVDTMLSIWNTQDNYKTMDGWYTIHKPIESLTLKATFVDEKTCENRADEEMKKWKELYSKDSNFETAKKAFGEGACKKVGLLERGLSMISNIAQKFTKKDGEQTQSKTYFLEIPQPIQKCQD